MADTIEMWVRRLRVASRPVLQGTPITDPESFSVSQRVRFIETFADEFGARREVDPFLLARVLRVPWPSALPPGEPWLEIWSTLALGRAGGITLRQEPPIAADPSCWALEQQSARELAATHALWHHAHANPALMPVLDRAALWLIANVQPDNATNHPWAVHVFAGRASRLGDTPEGQMSAMYAQQLYHNPLVARGTPDLLSAVIFWDAALGLEATSNCTDTSRSPASPSWLS